MQTYSNIIRAMQTSATCLCKECSSTITYNISFKLVQHLLEKKMTYYCKLCKICVNQGKPSCEDAHTVYIYMIIYVCMYIYF